METISPRKPQSLQSLLMAKNISLKAVLEKTATVKEERAAIVNDQNILANSIELSAQELPCLSELIYDNIIDDISVVNNNEVQMEATSLLENSIIVDKIVAVPCITEEIKTLDIINLKEISLQLDSANSSILKLKVENDLLKNQVECHEADLRISQEQYTSAKREVGSLKSTIAKTKYEYDTLFSKLSVELAQIKLVKTDAVASNASTMQKCTALESERSELLEQLRIQVEEYTIFSSRTSSNLNTAERRIAHLESENLLQHQLRIDLDTANRDNSQLRRSFASLEQEIVSLMSQNFQLRRFNSNAGTSRTTSLAAAPVNSSSSSCSDSSSNTSLTANFNPKSIGYHSTSKSQIGRKREDSFKIENRKVLDNNDNFEYEVNGNHMDSIWNHNNQNCNDSHRMSVKSLAELMDDRRNSTALNKNYGNENNYNTNGNKINFPLSSGHINHQNGKVLNDYPSINSTPPLPPTLDSTLDSSLSSSGSISAPKRQSIGDTTTRTNRNSSGGGVSNFYDNSKTETAARAPYANDQTFLQAMASFEEADKRLTALMTEKSVLYEESARLQQRGGKILKDRTRSLQVDERLTEIGREIAIERKMLTTKPG